MSPTEPDFAAMDLAERRQHILDEPQPNDDLLIGIPAKRLQKVANILEAVLDGHELYRASALECIQYLRAEQMEQANGVGSITPTALERAAQIDPLPWPHNGPPQP
jgi:hypothetical protein